jgi:DNA-binding MarR family transcriptional regulator
MTPQRAKEGDHVDRFLDEIRDELPADLDVVVEGIVDRIHAIDLRIRKMLGETLEEYGLSSSDWPVLCALRWSKKPQRSAGDLARKADLTSGAMTTRLDHLERSGFVRRIPDPDDRRGVLVQLTPKGRKVHQEAIGVQAAKEALLAEALNQREKEQLNDLLRQVMLVLQDRVPKS